MAPAAAPSRRPADGRWPVIYADPPWPYSIRNKHGCIDRDTHSKYTTMTHAELRSFLVPAAPDAVLFMWAVAPQFAECVALLEHWGFAYAGVELTWLKTRASGQPARGVGHFTACNAEFLVVGLRGRLHYAPAETRLHAVKREHSRKPDAARERVLALAARHGWGRVVELFARDRTDPRLDFFVGDQGGAVAAPGAALAAEAVPPPPASARKRPRPEASEEPAGPPIVLSGGGGAPRACVLVETARPEQVARLDLRGVLAADGFAAVRCDARGLLATARALQGDGRARLAFRTLLFFACDPRDPRRNEFWLAAAYRDASIKRARRCFRSQVVALGGARHPLLPVLAAAEEVFGDDPSVAVARVDARDRAVLLERAGGPRPPAGL